VRDNEPKLKKIYTYNNITLGIMITKYLAKIFYPTSHTKCLKDSVFHHRDSSSEDLTKWSDDYKCVSVHVYLRLMQEGRQNRRQMFGTSNTQHTVT